jgi:branched-chain amino acid transport system ATP-binding protein
MRTGHPKRAPLAVAQGDELLLVSDLEVRYGGIKALKGVSMSVRRGEVVALIGANGAGKTTMLKTIARLLPAAAGSVHYASTNLADVSTEELVENGVALVPEGRAIFPNLTVRENLEIGAYLHRDPKAMRDTIEDVTGLFPRLGERMRQEGGTLSGGEQQMLAIGRALMSRPDLLLLDEPSLGIAPKLVQDIFAAIVQIAKAGVTILVVEQNTRMALSHSQRGYVLRTGEMAMEGEAKALLQNTDIQKAYLGG